MSKKDSTFAQIASGGFIDIDLHENAKNVLIIGNTYGFFGYYKDGNRGVDLDEDKTGEMEKMSERLIWMSNALQNGTKFTIFGNTETLKYYQMVFEFFNDSIKFNWKNQIKVKQIEKDSEYLEYMNMAKDNNMKFDFVIQNPPYSGSLHLDFLEKGLEILDNGNGKMTIIEPATWLINVRKNGKAKKYDELKKKLEGHVYKVIIENFNNEFHVGLSVPCSITYVNMNKIFNTIEYICNGEKTYVCNINDCNLIGKYNIINSIFEKISKYDKMKNHIFNKQTKIDKNTKFAAIAKVMRGGIGDPRFSDEWFINNHYRCYYYHCFNDKEKISNEQHRLLQTGYTYENPKYKNEFALNIFGTQQELENFKHFVYNNKLCLFLNICIIQNMNTCNIQDYVPWLVDKQYSDEEINQMFGFTEEEITLIDRTIKKYERYSPWFKRYMCGPSSVSDEEVQKFIDSLNG